MIYRVSPLNQGQRMCNFKDNLSGSLWLSSCTSHQKLDLLRCFFPTLSVYKEEVKQLTGVNSFHCFPKAFRAKPEQTLRRNGGECRAAAVANWSHGCLSVLTST